MGTETQGLGLSSSVFLGRVAGAGSEMEQPELELALIWDASSIDRCLSYYSMASNHIDFVVRNDDWG